MTAAFIIFLIIKVLALILFLACLFLGYKLVKTLNKKQVSPAKKWGIIGLYSLFLLIVAYLTTFVIVLGINT
ncbi:hypothetical protein [Streptococcus suis]|uniref:hypothetical protein n=1 Tax=Streptococcus suis TaxID=1307 RepID=UPI000CF480A1|nr:hypothetical protein [Streptococcus suis]